ncbi:UNVERIFIED_CONTAM: hypothetical protein GTU68_006978 [Idotea baltica]|nr:hypothetical protein [Idotea baltica]
MCGYSAPKLDTVRVGIIGLGRGRSHLRAVSKLEGVEVKGISDLIPTKIERAKELLKGTDHHPDVYTGSEEKWKEMCERDDIDLIYVATPWHLHVPMALYAMEHGKHVGIEVPAATSIEDCWRLVEKSEETRCHCVILENCCYDFFELLTLNMSREGFFGEIVHAEGAYIHDLLRNLTAKDLKWNMWRLKENTGKSGNLYPTHGLGPIAQILNINRGDKMDYLVSMSGNDFMLGEKVRNLADQDDFYLPYRDQSFRGNMNTSIIRTIKGKTIMVQHDVTSPRPYSRLHIISGTKGTAQKYPLPGKISRDHEGWLDEGEMQAIEKKYQPAIVQKVGEVAKEVGGHGGMDFLMNWRLIDCLRNGLPMDMDVYDAATWSVVLPLSIQSVSNRSMSVDVPDFTAGSWKENEPVDILLEKGGNTKVKS